MTDIMQRFLTKDVAIYKTFSFYFFYFFFIFLLFCANNDIHTILASLFWWRWFIWNWANWSFPFCPATMSILSITVQLKSLTFLVSINWMHKVLESSNENIKYEVSLDSTLWSHSSVPLLVKSYKKPASFFHHLLSLPKMVS